MLLFATGPVLVDSDVVVEVEDGTVEPASVTGGPDVEVRGTDVLDAGSVVVAASVVLDSGTVVGGTVVVGAEVVDVVAWVVDVERLVDVAIEVDVDDDVEVEVGVQSDSVRWAWAEPPPSDDVQESLAAIVWVPAPNDSATVSLA